MSEEEYPWYQLKYKLAEFIIPALEDYKENYNRAGMSLPTWILEDRETQVPDEAVPELQNKWNQELDHIILSFKQVLNYNTGESEEIGYDEEFIQEGLNKFAKYFIDFWD